jgi:CAAX protease family protein
MPNPRPERPTHPPRSTWTWSAILAAVLTLPLFVAPVLAESLGWRINSVITRLMLIGSVLVLLCWLGLPRPRTLVAGLGPTPARSLGRALAITIGVCALYSALLIWFEVETLRTWAQFKNPHRLVMGLLTGLVVSFVEEPIFRGQFLRRLSFGGNVLVGSILSSLLYALVHYVRPDKVARKAEYSLTDSLDVYRDILGNFLEPLSDPIPGLGLFLLGMLLCAVVRRGGLAWTIGIHSGVVYYVKADSSFLFWNLDEDVRDPMFGSFEVKYDSWMFCIACSAILVAVLVFVKPSPDVETDVKN